MKQIITLKKLIVVVLIFTACFVVYSCKTISLWPNPLYPERLSATADTLVNINHFIDSARAWSFIDRYTTYKDSIHNNQLVINGHTYTDVLTETSEAFNKLIVVRILNLPNCVGVHIYHGISEDFKEVLLLAGIGVNYETLYIQGSYNEQTNYKQKGAAPPPIQGSGMAEMGKKP